MVDPRGIQQELSQPGRLGFSLQSYTLLVSPAALSIEMRCYESVQSTECRAISVSTSRLQKEKL